LIGACAWTAGAATVAPAAAAAAVAMNLRRLVRTLVRFPDVSVMGRSSSSVFLCGM
jgi:hypothetical protein